MLSFKFDDKLIVLPEYYTKYYGTIDLSAEIYFDERLIGKVNAEFLNSLSKEFKQFLIDNNIDKEDEEQEFLNYIIKLNPSYKTYIEEIYNNFNESKINTIDDSDFDNYAYFKSILIIKNIETKIQINRNELIEKYIETINCLFSFNEFYTLDIEDKSNMNDVEKNTNARDISELKIALDNCVSRDERLNIALLNYCKKNNVEYVDKREKGGCLWIVGGHDLEKEMNLLIEYKIKFIFSPNGGRASKHRQAWYFK